MIVVIKERKAQVRKCSAGILVRKPLRDSVWVIPDNRRKRGKQVTFSAASARRLREKLLHVPSFNDTWGVTLTLQKDKYHEFGKEFFRDFFKRFCDSLRGRCRLGHISREFFFLWRIELTKEKTPHFHCVVNGSFSDLMQMRDLFLKMLRKYYDYSPPPDVAVDYRRIDNYDDAYNYVCSHATKHKREQLGWAGRQWGIFFIASEAREIFEKSVADGSEWHDAQCKLWKNTLEISDKDYSILRRLLRRYFFAKFRNNDVDRVKAKNYRRDKRSGKVSEEIRTSTTTSFRLRMLKNNGAPVRTDKVNCRRLAVRQSQQSSFFVAGDLSLNFLKMLNVREIWARGRSDLFEQSVFDWSAMKESNNETGRNS